MAIILNGRLRFIKGAGYGTTWFVPTVLGAINVATASPEERVQVAFEEGFSVLGGAIGTRVGVIGGLGVVAVLGLGPFGAFAAVIVLATFGGLAGMRVGKELGAVIHDLGTPSSNTPIFNSPEHLSFCLARGVLTRLLC